MALPLKDIQVGFRQHTHKVLTRIAEKRRIHLNELLREIVEAYVDQEIHDAKLVLGIDVDKPEQGELGLEQGEPGRIAPKQGRK